MIGSLQPYQDAQVLTGLIRRIEYQGLLHGPQRQADEEMLCILTRQMRLVLGTPQPVRG
ncbi:hypothetical protein PSE10A_28100 [Pseudomonas amygdali pv. eriobotryae]|uniref:TetR family transcriptional regulator n=1 Tax=Pseudomonas amygdali pv. eriobotryae TaxID=129137 RepID=A0A9P3ADZ8_PSEA0|nr:hypothetical protein PSE10A_28100 [Pseudomonas amygdali pv. eriobotryae]